MNKSWKEYLNINRDLWNTLAPLHEKSTFYDVAGFKQGKTSLKHIELEEMGDVSGKTLLHLQCHFGLDTLSWARRGARVTGVDFSDKAIKIAASLKTELGLEADFICSNIYDLPDVLDRKFDIVFTSYGVLAWLPDLDPWARVIHHSLRDDGFFYIVDFHPIMEIINDAGVVHGSYFPVKDPYQYTAHGSYATDEDITHTQYEWVHTMADIITALIDAGFVIDFLHEFPYSVYGDRPYLVQGKDGLWRHKNEKLQLPLLFSIKARCVR
jgi:SAM-dependent methyltransferase